MRSFASDDLAVSETLGYIIIFSIITACIAMVFIIGSQIISDTQESTSFQGTEQSFEVIGSDIRRTAFEASPVMTTRLKVDYGTICLFPEDMSGAELIVAFNGEEHRVRLGTLTYLSSRWGKSISLENGALVKMVGGNGTFGSIMTLQPQIFYSQSTSTLYVSVVNIQCLQASQGGGICNIQSKFLDSSITTIKRDTPDTAYLRVRTNYTGAWDDYFIQDFTPAMTLDTTGDTSHWTNASLSNVNRTVIVRYNISVSF